MRAKRPCTRWCRCCREIMHAVAALLSLWRTRLRRCMRCRAAAMAPLLSPASSKQCVFWLDAAHLVVVERDAADAAVGGEHPGLRPDLLGGEDAVHRREQRVPVE